MTNDCAVYVAGADGWDFIKVGVTRNGDGRLANLQTGCPIEIRILSIRHGLSAEHAADLETAIHLLLADRHSKGSYILDKYDLIAYLLFIGDTDDQRPFRPALS